VRIDILAIGSQGDVRPNIALGLGLRRHGHDVRIVTLDGFGSSVQAHGLEHLSIGRSPREIADSSEGRQWIARRDSTVGFLRGFVRVARTLIDEGIGNYWQQCQDAEALIVSPMGLPIGVHIAERLRVPLIRQYFAPGTPTRYDWAGRKNLKTAVRAGVTAYAARAFRLAIWSQLRATTNDVRRRILDLPRLPLKEPFDAMDRRRIPVLNAYSHAVVPRPPDWAPWVHVTGYWFLDEAGEWTPPAELTRFLEAGRPPIFIGFGSTPFPNAAQAADAIIGALGRSRRRGIVIAGGSGLPTGRLSDDVLSIAAAPHDWLFSRVTAAVHHGGAGVTGAALRAGLPSVVVPVFGDQPFWGRRVHALGAGPRPLPARQLTLTALAERIAATADESMRRRALALAERIRGEHGVAQAVAAIEAHVGASGAAA
jgi:UDP:flavonoid glycosyltransferase YjiC (YdhE family)